MVLKLNNPDFKSEKEEAEWWPLQEDLIADAFEKAAADGTLEYGTLVKRSGVVASTIIPLDPNDIELARTQAERKGLKYQAYLKMLIHEALLSQEKST